MGEFQEGLEDVNLAIRDLQAKQEASVFTVFYSINLSAKDRGNLHDYTIEVLTENSHLREAGVLENVTNLEVQIAASLYGTLKGSYDGETYNEEPHGEGTFTESHGGGVYVGTFRNNKFDGIIKFDFEGFYTQICEYTENFRSGHCTIYEEDFLVDNADYDANDVAENEKIGITHQVTDSSDAYFGTGCKYNKPCE